MSENVELVLSKIKEIELSISGDIFADYVEYYNKIVAVLNTLKQRVKSQKIILYNWSIVGNVQRSLDQLYSYISSWNTSKNHSYINHINTVLNELLDYIAKIPAVQKGETANTINKVLMDFEQNNISIIKLLNAEKDVLEKQVNDLTKSISLLEKRIEDKTNLLDQLSTNQQQQFSDAQEKRINDFAAKLGEFECQFSEQQQEQGNLYANNFQRLKEEAEKRLSDMEQIQHKVEQIYEIVGKESIVGSQSFYANEAESRSRFYFWTSFVFMAIVALGALAVFLIAWYKNTSMTFEWLVARLSFFGIFLLPAIYMANESRKQRDKENTYRELEIKMACIEPYFNNISDEPKDTNSSLPEKDSVKLELAKNLLSPINSKTEDNVIIPKDVLDFVKDITNVATGKK